MTGEQFDLIIGRINYLIGEVDELKKVVNTNNEILKSLVSKTVVISDVDKQIESLKLDIKSLIDEQEM